MDIRDATWLFGLEIEESCDFLNQHQHAYPYYSDSIDSLSSESFKGYPNLVIRNQSIQATTINGDLGKQKDYKATKSSLLAPGYGSSSKTSTISFGNLTSPPEINEYDQLYGGSKLKHPHAVKPEDEMSLNEFLGSTKVAKRVPSTSRNYRQAQDHILAERKRREKMAQRFNSLSALLPELKKMDKATVLEDASKYIIQLQTRVKELKERSVKGKDIIQESTVSIRRSKFCGGHEDNASSSDETNSIPSSSAYDPEIKVRISGSNILVRIYCGRNSSLVLKTLSEMERLHITVICSRVLQFSNTALLITIIGQKSDEFVMRAMDLVKCLQSTLRSFP